MCYYNQAPNYHFPALVAQLDRVFDYESKGRGFESLRAHHNKSLKNPPQTAQVSRFVEDLILRVLLYCLDVIGNNMIDLVK